MEDRVEVTVYELMDVLRDVITPDDPDGAFTIRELEELTGTHRHKLERQIREGLNNGKIERATVYREMINGVTRRTSGYRLARRSNGASTGDGGNMYERGYIQVRT